jgi:hypothetical protein
VARFVFDGDTLTYILQRRDSVLTRLEAAVRSKARIYLCPIETNPRRTHTPTPPRWTGLGALS